MTDASDVYVLDTNFYMVQCNVNNVPRSVATDRLDWAVTSEGAYNLTNRALVDQHQQLLDWNRNGQLHTVYGQRNELASVVHDMRGFLRRFQARIEGLVDNLVLEPEEAKKRLERAHDISLFQEDILQLGKSAPSFNDSDFFFTAVYDALCAYRDNPGERAPWANGPPNAPDHIDLRLLSHTLNQAVRHPNTTYELRTWDSSMAWLNEQLEDALEDVIPTGLPPNYRFNRMYFDVKPQRRRELEEIAA